MSEITENEKLEIHKANVMEFVELGIPFEQACEEAWVTKEQLQEIEKDQEFIDIIRQVTIKNKKEFLREYNSKVKNSKNPADAVKKLQAQFPDVFREKEKAPEAQTAPILITIGDGRIEEIPPPKDVN